MTFHTVDAGSVDDNIIAGFHVGIVVAGMGDKDVMALDLRFSGLGRCAVVALPEILATA